MNIRSISVHIWIVLVFMFLGFLLQVLSFCFPTWNKLPAQTETLGLWQRCPNAGCVAVSMKNLTVTLEVSRILQAFGLVCFISLIVVALLYICWRSNLKLLTGAIVLCFMTMLFNMIGALIWSSVSNTTIYWAYYLCYASSLTVAVSGGILVYIRRQIILGKSL